MYSGLTNQQRMKLAIVALKNVKQYVKDAKLLIDNHSYGRALSLSILGIEEFAKGMILHTCSFDFLNQEEKDELLKKGRLTDHKTKLDKALDYAITLMLSSWAGEEYVRAFESNDPIKIIETMNIWKILQSEEKNEILNRTDDGKLLLKALETKKSNLFQTKLLDKKKQNGFYVDLNVNPLNTTYKDVEPYYEYLLILTALATKNIAYATEMLNNQGLFSVHQDHYSKFREEVEKLTK